MVEKNKEVGVMKLKTLNCASRRSTLGLWLSSASLVESHVRLTAHKMFETEITWTCLEADRIGSLKFLLVSK